MEKRVELFKKVENLYGVYSGLPLTKDEDLVPVYPTGRWKIDLVNGAPHVYIEDNITRWSSYPVEKEVPRKWFKFLFGPTKKIKEMKHEKISISEWVHEDKLVLVESIINECTTKGERQ